MKKYLISILIVLAVVAIAQDASNPVKSGKRDSLAWDHEFTNDVAFWMMKVFHTNGVMATNILITNIPPTLQVRITNVMAFQANGEYRANLTAFNSDGDESEESNQLYIFWYGKPAPPSKLGLIRQSSTNSLPPTP